MATSSYKLLGVSASELKPGFMKECEIEGVEGAKVLLVQYGQNVRAMNSHCSHYNLPLVKGCLTADGRVLCPFHGSCFRADTGEIEDGPGLDSLHTFAVKINEENITIEAEISKIKAGRRTPDMATISQATDGTNVNILIVGGGSGAVGAIEGLRQHGSTEQITVLSKESYLPIDRTKLSKALITDPQKVALRDADFYRKFGVNMQTSTTVKSVDFDKHTVTTDKGQTYTYKKLILATGGTPRNLPLEGFKNLSNIFVLRTIDDVRAIMQAAGENGGKNIVIAGSSFISCESAVALAGKKHKVTVIGMENVPMQRVIGEKIGATFQKLMEKKDIRFAMSATVDRAEPNESDKNRVGAIVLKDGTKFEADMVILGVGVYPETTYLDSSILQKDGSLSVDGNFQIQGVADAYAVGDIATFPYKGQNVRIEHYSVAQNSGRSAGMHIAKGKNSHQFVPIFWSALGVQLRYCGYGADYDDIVVNGSLDDNKFVAFFTKGQDVIAVATMQKDPVMVYASELMRVGAMPSKKEIQEGLDITTLTVPTLKV